jgi:hypothetical protein
MGRPPLRPNRKRPPGGIRRARRCRSWPTATTAAYPPCAAPPALAKNFLASDLHLSPPTRWL